MDEDDELILAAREGCLFVGGLEEEEEEEDEEELLDRVSLLCDGVDEEEETLTSPPPDTPPPPRFNLFKKLRALLGGASEAVVDLPPLLLFNLAFLANGESLEMASFRLRRPWGTRDFLLLIIPCLALIVPLLPPPPAAESIDFLRSGRECEFGAFGLLPDFRFPMLSAKLGAKRG